MADNRLLTKERLDDCRKVVSSINPGMTPDHRAFIHNLLGQGAPALLVHIDAQTEQIEQLEARLRSLLEVVKSQAELVEKLHSEIEALLRVIDKQDVVRKLDISKQI